jgi:serpin B
VTAPVAEVVAGMRAFALRLAATQPVTGNLVFSPMSIATAFAMVEAGAAAGTAADIARVFDLPDQPDVHEAIGALAPALAPRSDKVTLDVANAIWVQQNEPIGQPFLDTLDAHYGAGVETVDFQRDAEAARQAINAWVSQVTRERIPELLPPGRVDALTLVAVVNAVYLDAPWRSPFDKAATAEAPFTLPDGATVPVPTMHHPRLATTASVADDGSAGVKLFYEGSDLAMVVLLPPVGTSLADYEAGLTASTLAGAVQSLAQAEVDLALPRWDIATDLDLAPPLTSLGLTIPGGDLSGIARDARIGAALHAATITVNEKRTVASAATAVIVERVVFVERPHLQIKVDRPFLFVVQHQPTGAPLFYGRITDPRR